MHQSPLRIRYVGGPTALLELGGVRLLTDPTFDPPGEYAIGTRTLTKTIGPALTAAALAPVDAVLLSHDQHPDNLDRLGRDYLSQVAVVLSTASAQARIGGNVRTLSNWQAFDVTGAAGDVVRVTGVPAQHGPDGTEHLTGEVTGFVLSGAGLPTVYVSGDNASLNVVAAIADRFDTAIDIAVLFVGGAQTPLLGDAYLTLTSPQAVEAASRLGVRQVVPLHFEGWGHFTQGADTLQTAFGQSPLADRLQMPRPGDWLVVA